MSLADVVKAQTRKALRAQGEPVILKHVTGEVHDDTTATNVKAYADVPAVGVRDYSSYKNLGEKYGQNHVSETCFEAVIVNEIESPHIVTIGDKLVFSDTTANVIEVKPIYMQGVLICHTVLAES